MIRHLIYRIRYNWTFTRILFVVMGITILIQAISIMQWPGILLGSYFMLMGGLGFGCAAGQCMPMPQRGKNDTEDITYTEIK